MLKHGQLSGSLFWLHHKPLDSVSAQTTWRLLVRFRGDFSSLEASSGSCRGRFCFKDSLKQQIKQITFSAEHLRCCAPGSQQHFVFVDIWSRLGDDWVLKYQRYRAVVVVVVVSLFFYSKHLWTWTFLTSCKKNDKATPLKVRIHVSKLKEIHWLLEEADFWHHTALGRG